MRVLVYVLSYLIGTFSSAYIIGKVFLKIDIRGHGSGNSGATNAVRVMGKKFGILTFLLDFLKGVLAVVIGSLLLGEIGGLYAALFAVVGHNWPFYLNFKGGKGVSTTIGGLALLNFPVALISVIIGVSVGAISKFVSLGSITFFITVPIITLLWDGFNRPKFLILTILLGIIGLYRHKANIQRLLSRTENRIGG